MNRLINLIVGWGVVLAALTLSACSDDDHSMPDTPQIFIEEPYYTLARNSVTIKVGADVAPTEDIAIPIVFGGSAVKDFDFTASDSVVVIKAGETEGFFVINRVVENIGADNKELYVNLKSAPEGYRLGLMNYASVTLLSNEGVLMSFDEATAEVALLGDITINLTSMSGSRYRTKVATTFKLIVDPSSTAVEGEHFEFVNGPQITIPKNKYKGTITLRCIKHEEGHDKLVLRLADKDGYGIGNLGTITIKLKGQDNFTGTWQLASINTDEIKQYYVEDESKAPKGSDKDLITFSGSEAPLSYTFTPNLQGDLKNYFGNDERSVTWLEDTQMTYQMEMGATRYVSTLQIPNVNVNFSSTQTSLRTAKVAFRLFEENGEQMLECSIYDWEPQGDDYGAMIYSFMGDMSYSILRVYFTRKK